MAIFSDHSYTSITIKVNQLIQHKNDEIEDIMELYLSDLLHLIKIQPQSGATEAARAIRKKIKYGDSVEEQKRALKLLELLVLNSGNKIGTIIARDDKLLDVLKSIINGHGKTGLGSNYDVKIQKMAINMSLGWKTEFQDLQGYKYMQELYKNIPKRIRNDSTPRRNRTPESDEEEYLDDENDPYSDDNTYDEPRQSKSKSSTPRATKSPKIQSPKIPPPRPTTASPYSTTKKDKKDKKKSKKKKSKNGIIYADEEYAIPQINYKLETPKINNLLSECNSITITLNNQLLHLSSNESPQDSTEIMKNFNQCKKIRRKILKYLQFVGAGNTEDKSPEILRKDEEFLSRLIFANEQLIETFKKFDSKSGYSQENPAPSLDDDREWSDSDESYYDSEEYESEVEDTPEDSISSRLQSVTMDTKRAPPPPPPTKKFEKQPTLKNGFNENGNRPTLSKMETSDSVVSNDPFGDKNEVSKSSSVYY
ncbi:hypothetical protein KGF54_003172 [Candida jiufengensis]|uniref:uncharacterized protein n=1 Tax=Candida jiufengensis TaxID=497108 RepID=UPI002225460E|nr:uncharacterized protein KGF54_003172 [Candida jiufengensis]KAI5952306.1 hypothetical protein KGF54_003172 [Candida jiufengensis]